MKRSPVLLRKTFIYFRKDCDFFAALIMNKINKKKAIATSLIAVASLGLITAGTLALFTDYADADDEGIAGILDINIHDFKMTNKDNINPGDNDPLAPTTYVPLSGDPLYDPANPTAEVPVSTTDHVITYSISNDGNQSARVRRSFYISCKTPSGEVLDPSNFYLFNGAHGEGELADKYLIDSENNQYLVGPADPVAHPAQTVPADAKIIAVKYVENLDIYDGIGKGAQKEKEATVTEKDGKVSKDFLYHFGMAQSSPNIYQGVNVEIEIIVEGLQFRNTTDAKWEVTSTHIVNATTSGINVPIVPSAVPIENQTPAETTAPSNESTPDSAPTETRLEAVEDAGAVTTPPEEVTQSVTESGEPSAPDETTVSEGEAGATDTNA